MALQVAPRVALSPKEAKRLNDAMKEIQAKGKGTPTPEQIFGKAIPPKQRPHEIGVSNKEPSPSAAEE